MAHIKKTHPLDRKINSPNPVSESSNTLYPLFDLSRINADSFHALKQCTDCEKAAFADKLAELSQLTWQELTQAYRHGLGFEKIASYPKPAYVTDEVNIIAFRFCGMAAMLGFRINRTFTIIALDRNFTAYTHH